MHTSKLSGSSKFQLCFYSLNIQANSTQLVETSGLLNVLSEYHEFANVFSKAKANGVATTSQKTNSNISNKSQDRYQVEIIRKLNKESLIHCYSIYIIDI